jgi:uncharacterized tellurite resistance protein B-like protein
VSFSTLIQRFKTGLAPQQPDQPRHEPLRLATAAVLLEIANADGTFSPAEGENLTGYLQRVFQLDEGETQDLIEAAEEVRAHTIDHFALTHYIRKNASLEERIEIVKTMWRMSYSDGQLNDYENHLVRKLADLLGIEHRAMIDAKTAVLEELGRAAR